LGKMPYLKPGLECYLVWPKLIRATLVERP
jgi:hypothetical protein